MIRTARRPHASLLGSAALALTLACGSPGGPTGGATPDASEGRTAAAPGAQGPPLLDLDAVRLVDLTHPLSSDSLYWPTGSPFEHRRLDWGADEEGRWYAAAAFSSPEHLGTHLDAPIHFAAHGWTATDIPVDRFIGPAAVIDISARAAHDPDTTLETEDILAWEETHGALAAGSIVLVRTGWSSRWPDWERYYGSATPKAPETLRFPGLAVDAAARLVERGVTGVGIDTASLDPGVSTTFDSHRVLAEANVFGLENLTGLDALPESGSILVALPMKIAGGTGGPTRVVALVPR